MIIILSVTRFITICVLTETMKFIARSWCHTIHLLQVEFHDSLYSGWHMIHDKICGTRFITKWVPWYSLKWMPRNYPCLRGIGQKLWFALGNSFSHVNCPFQSWCWHNIFHDLFFAARKYMISNQPFYGMKSSIYFCENVNWVSLLSPQYLQPLKHYGLFAASAEQVEPRKLCCTCSYDWQLQSVTKEHDCPVPINHAGLAPDLYYDWPSILEAMHRHCYCMAINGVHRYPWHCLIIFVIKLFCILQLHQVNIG